ncbi:Tetrahydromethanopterin S-methyltransferase subunit H [Candidatus Gugararchaeum adminiculabundum]|nr:Tetrahydromethanopterin S-methyltransferase subunit H [Candidatus Gugararchaeum adminiculabundum]
MLTFSSFQKKLKIAGVEFGGQPKEREPVIFASVKSSAEISKLKNSPEKFGVHLFFTDFAKGKSLLISAQKIFQGPVMIESTDPIARARLALFAKETGFNSNLIYSSLNTATSFEELELLRDAKVAAATIYCLGSDSSVESSMKTAERLIAQFKNCGTKNFLLDAAALPKNQGPDWRRAIIALKQEFGLPTGFSAKAAAEKSEDELALAAVGAFAGADFIVTSKSIEASRAVKVAARF